MAGGSVEFVLYKTPVITYHPNGDVVVKTDGWSSISTHQFISQVLGVSCYGSRRNTVMEVRSSGGGADGVGKVIVPKNKGVTLIHAGGNWRITKYHAMYEYRLNRKAAGAVRKKYADFINYAKGMVKIRSEIVEPSKYSIRKNPYGMVTLAANETATSARIDVDKLSMRVAMLVNPNQPEDTKHLNYGEALSSILRGCIHHRASFASEGYFRVVAAEALALMDELLLRQHAQEVLVWTGLEAGKVPSGKYRGWLPERG
jgi:hypothetical protein